MLATATLSLLCALSLGGAEPPWVKTGTSPKHPSARYLTGFATASGADALARAKNDAAADLAKRLLVKVEQTVTDVAQEKNGVAEQSVVAMTRTSTNLALTGLTYETHEANGQVYALAVVERAVAAEGVRAERQRAVQAMHRCMESAGKLTGVEAAKGFLACRAPITEAFERDGIVRLLAPLLKADDEARQELLEASARIDSEVQRLLASPAKTLKDVVGFLALQLELQGAASRGRMTVAAPTYGTTPFSSALGRYLALELEQALLARAGAATAKSDVVLTGSYSEVGDMLTIRMLAREPVSGRALGSAAAQIGLAMIPADLPARPQNFAEALRDQRLLGHGEEVSGDLRFEMWTNKGHNNLVFSEGDELKLYMRVNQPAYVQLVYLLANGMRVALEQAYYIDASKVNMAVEYPSTFEVSAPFGAEQLYAIASTEKPTPLLTQQKLIDGASYDIVADTQALVKHRGLKVKQAQKKAEASLGLTTVGRR